MATLGDPSTIPFTYKPKGVSAVPFNLSPVSLVIAQAKLSDTISVIWTANYAYFVEFGTSKMQPRRFVGLAAQTWKQIVSQVCKEVEAKYNGVI
jgi:HK97 gp10 family phage protein